MVLNVLEKYVYDGRPQIRDYHDADSLQKAE